MIIVLSIWLGIVSFLLIGALGYARRLEQQIELLDREKHEQNKHIMQLMVEDNQIKEMLLQHVEILRYLCDQDPILSKTRIPYTGPIGEA